MLTISPGHEAVEAAPALGIREEMRGQAYRGPRHALSAFSRLYLTWSLKLNYRNMDSELTMASLIFTVAGRIYKANYFFPQKNFSWPFFNLTEDRHSEVI